MSGLTAVLDANVLYPAPLRDLLMQLAVMDLFAAKWTAEIHREWIEALPRNEPHWDRAALERTRDLMDLATRDSLVTSYEPLIPVISLPDAYDNHVLAAAIVGRCDVIVTQNLKHFPAPAFGAVWNRGSTSRRVPVQSFEPRAGLVLQCCAQGKRPAQESALQLRDTWRYSQSKVCLLLPRSWNTLQRCFNPQTAAPPQTSAPDTSHTH